MTLETVVCITVELNDAQANHHKFYRAYACGNWSVFQWGRIGALGQWSGTLHNFPSQALDAAHDQIASKTAKGYVRVDTVSFTYDESKLSIDKDHLVGLDAVRRRDGRPGLPSRTATTPPASPRRAPRVAAPQPTPPPVADALNPHSVFAARALAAISLAVTDQRKAAEEFAILNHDWKELEIQHAKAASYLKTLDQLLIGANA